MSKCIICVGSSGKGFECTTCKNYYCNIRCLQSDDGDCIKCASDKKQPNFTKNQYKCYGCGIIINSNTHPNAFGCQMCSGEFCGINNCCRVRDHVKYTITPQMYLCIPCSNGRKPN